MKRPTTFGNRKEVDAVMRILPFWLLLFVYVAPSSFAADVASRDSIRELQTILSLRGLYDGRIDGLNGLKTERAILLYERNNARSPIGQPSSQLLETLREEFQAELNRGDGSNAADKSQLNELRDKVDALRQALTDSERERASLSNAVVRIGKGLQTDKSFRERDLESITIGSTLIADITSNVLAIMALALAAGLLAAYVGLRAMLESRFKTMLDTAAAAITFQVYGSLSHAFYLYYRELLDKPWHGAFQSGVALATWFANGAISNAEKLPSKYPEKQELLMYAKIHRAHHYASQEPQSSQIARDTLLFTSSLKDFTDRLWKKGKKDNWAACRDSLAWILIRLGDRQQQGEGRRIVHALLEHDDVPPPIRDHIRENYRRIGEII